MRIQAVLPLIALACCSQASQEPQANADCTPLISQDDLKYASKKSLAIDCLIVKSREYSFAQFEAHVISEAVAKACDDEIESYSAAVRDDIIIRIPHIGAAAMQAQDEAEKEIEAKAIQYVVEARALHCNIKRNAKAPPDKWWSFVNP